MRIQFKSFVFALAISMFYANISQAMPGQLFDKDSAANVKKHRPFYGFYSLDYGISWTNSSQQLNNWLQHEGYVPTGSNQSIYGFTETFFSGKWMFEGAFIGLKTFGFGNASSMENFSIGAGYNIFSTKFFGVYGGLNFGTNSFYLYPNQTMASDFGQYNQPSGSRFEQDAWLVNPHILLYRNLTKNLSERPGHVNAIGFGIEGGFNLAFSQSDWTYGNSKSNPYSSVTVSGIPNSAFSGFYVMGRIGWFFGRQ